MDREFDLAKFDEYREDIGAVLEMIKADPSVSRAEISARMQISDSQARTAIEKLKERGIIRREGSDTNGKWVISL